MWFFSHKSQNEIKIQNQIMNSLYSYSNENKFENRKKTEESIKNEAKIDSHHS